MFTHVIQRDGKFYVRRWTPFWFEHWDAATGYWWLRYPEHWTGFATAEAARDAYRNSRGKFAGWA
jgi:hypothetical protein